MICLHRHSEDLAYTESLQKISLLTLVNDKIQAKLEKRVKSQKQKLATFKFDYRSKTFASSLTKEPERHTTPLWDLSLVAPQPKQKSMVEGVRTYQKLLQQAAGLLSRVKEMESLEAQI